MSGLVGEAGDWGSGQGGRRGEGEVCVRYMRREPRRKPRKVRSVTGWAERRQLSAPGSLSAMVGWWEGKGYSIELERR